MPDEQTRKDAPSVVAGCADDSVFRSAAMPGASDLNISIGSRAIIGVWQAFESVSPRTPLLAAEIAIGGIELRRAWKPA